MDRMRMLGCLTVFVGIALLAGCGGQEEPPTENPVPPGEVGELTATASCSSGNPVITLAWDAIAGVESYVLERDYVEIAELADPTVTSHSDTAVEAGQAYTYRLTAVNAQGASSGTPVTATVPFDVCVGAGIHISASNMTSLMVAADGSVWAWGAAGSGAFGTGLARDAQPPTQMTGVSGAISAILGAYHSLILDSHGQVWTSGNNTQGQLGVGLAVREALSPLSVSGLPQINAIAAGRLHNLALAEDGTVWAWGDNDDGQIGLGTTTDIVPLPTQIPGLEDVAAVYAGGESSFAVHTDGSVSAWGDNSYGQLGLGDQVNRSAPALVPGLTGVLDVAAGTYSATVLTDDGRAWSMGDGDWTGTGSTGPVMVPLEVPELAGAVDIHASYEFTLAAMADGTVLGWGDNRSRQLTDSTNFDEPLPVQVQGLEDVVAVAAGLDHGLALTSDGTVLAWGGNEASALGDFQPDPVYSYVPVELPDRAEQVAAHRHTVVLLEDGTVWTWGDAMPVALGLPSSPFESVPRQIEFPGGVTIVQVAAGTDFSLARDSDGNIWSWGNGDFGSLGHGTADDLAVPTKIAAGSLTFTDMATGGASAFAIAADGTLWAWGSNSEGELGVGGTSSAWVPTHVAGLTDVVAVDGGGLHMVAVLGDGTVWASGSDLNGALGDGNSTQTDVETPSQVVDLTNAATVATGRLFSIVLDSAGRFHSWGRNVEGQLGLGDWLPRHGPEAGPADLTWTMISANQNSVIGVDTAGDLYGWGLGEDGQYGQAGIFSSLVPLKLDGVPGGAAIEGLAMGDDFSMVIADGELFASGVDDYGQLGRGRVFMRPFPEAVEGVPPGLVAD